MQKKAKFSSAGGSAPDPQNSSPIANSWLRAWAIQSILSSKIILTATGNDFGPETKNLWNPTSLVTDTGNVG